MKKTTCQAGSLFITALIISLTIFTQCAEIVAPPGGEEDKIAPYLVSSIPENKALNVAPSREITLYFSENLNKPTSGQPIFISPRPIEPPEIKWKGDKIVIKLPDTFHVNQTYIVSVSPTVTDLRNNKLDSTLTLAFSTGPELDTGYISGFIDNESGAQSGMLVGLFEMSSIDSGVPIDSLYPMYLSTTNTQGYFSFQHLPDKEYRLIGFNDKNRDEHFNPFREQFALPDRPIVVGGKLKLDNLQMMVTSQDTTQIEIISAVLNSDRLLRIRLSQPIPLNLISSSPGNIMLKSSSDSGTIYPAKAIRETPLKESSQLVVYFEKVPEGIFNLEISYNPDKPTLVYKDLELLSKEDETPPEILSFEPDNTPHFVQEIDIRIKFTEPILPDKMNPATFLLVDSDTTPVKLSYEWLDPFDLKFTPAELTPGETYRFIISELDIRDLADNQMGDSLTTYQFTVIDNDSTGSISGLAHIALEDRQNNPIMMTFKKVGSTQSFEMYLNGEDFNIEVPAGKYLLSGYIDANLDEQFNPGTYQPFHLSETRAVYPDTIEVRARFETAGIEFIFE